MTTTEAKFSQLRNDMYWTHFDLDDGYIRWIGYDDAYWWDNVSKTDNARIRTGKVSGRVYELEHVSGTVFIAPALQAFRQATGELA